MVGQLGGFSSQVTFACLTGSPTNVTYQIRAPELYDSTVMQLTWQWHKNVDSTFPTTVIGSACSRRQHSQCKQHVFPAGPRPLSLYSTSAPLSMDQGAIENTRQKGLVLHSQSRYVDQARQSIQRVLARCWLDKSSSRKAGGNAPAVTPATGTLDAVAGPFNAQFDTWLSAILYDILDASTEPIRDGCLIMSNVLNIYLATHCSFPYKQRCSSESRARHGFQSESKKYSATTNGPRKVYKT